MSRDLGVVHNAGLNDGPKVYLPLEEVRIHVLILDVTARVTIDQVFSNPENTATSRAKYLFPVPASACLCAFEARKANGDIIVGKCMDKDRAREKHEAAIRQGKLTGLLENVTDDIFTISLGSIRSKETVETKVVYVLTLLNDDNADSVTFHLPAYVGQRYGPLPPALNDAASVSEKTRVHIKADIQTCGRLGKVWSPTHEVKETRYPTHRNRVSRRRTTVSYKSKQYLAKGFLLVIHAQGLDAPRCFAEVSRRSQRHGVSTVAFQLTMVPKFIIPELPCQEYIFLVDRSGSMAGQRIEKAKSTLALLLKLLPTHGTKFNIVSFGDTPQRFSSQSLPYDQATLEKMLAEVRNMQVGGGTELKSALCDVFELRDKSIPTAVFLLTDGEVYDKDPILDAVRSHVGASSPRAPLRVFVLGIGHEVSTDICESIAKTGGGVCLFAFGEETILGRCARLFQAGKTQFVKNATVDWGIPTDQLVSSSPLVDFVSEDRPGDVRLRAPPPLQQSPHVIPDLHAGTRQSICAILTVKDVSVPKEVVLRGQLSETGEALVLVIPVRLAQVADQDPTLPPVHSIAAWKLIQDQQDKLAPVPRATSVGLSEESLRKAEIVRLGVTYRISSLYTSFVAVDGEDQDLESRSRTQGQHFRHRPPGDHNQPENTNTVADTQPSNAPASPSLTTRIVDLFKRWTSPRLPPTSIEPEPRRRSRSPVRDEPMHDDDGYESERTFSTLSSFMGRSDWSDWSDSRPPSPPPLNEEDSRLVRSPSLIFQQSPNATTRPRQPLTSTTTVNLLKNEVVNLVALQSYNGAFQIDPSFTSLLGTRAVNDARGQGLDRAVWATALAVAFMKRNATAHAELWAKAVAYLRACGSERVIATAAEALGE
ncbi:hypothetical protein ONZ45_g2604 [Pleurotus djamor]|nr:hypothetical protein ONZ45_g2604 [Pleurotus djamor]